MFWWFAGAMVVLNGLQKYSEVSQQNAISQAPIFATVHCTNGTDGNATLQVETFARATAERWHKHASVPMRGEACEQERAALAWMKRIAHVGHGRAFAYCAPAWAPLAHGDGAAASAIVRVRFTPDAKKPFVETGVAQSHTACLAEREAFNTALSDAL